MPVTISDRLRKSIRHSKLSAGELSRLAGVPQQTISEFLNGRDMRLSRADKIAAYLKLKLIRNK